MGYSELSGKSLLIQPQCDLQLSGNKVYGVLELPGQQKLDTLWDGRGREGCWLLAERACSTNAAAACLLPEEVLT